MALPSKSSALLGLTQLVQKHNARSLDGPLSSIECIAKLIALTHLTGGCWGRSAATIFKKSISKRIGDFRMARNSTNESGVNCDLPIGAPDHAITID